MCFFDKNTSDDPSDISSFPSQLRRSEAKRSLVFLFGLNGSLGPNLDDGALVFECFFQLTEYFLGTPLLTSLLNCLALDSKRQIALGVHQGARVLTTQFCAASPFVWSKEQHEGRVVLPPVFFGEMEERRKSSEIFLAPEFVTSSLSNQLSSSPSVSFQS